MADALQFVQRPGHRTAYRRCGSGPPLVLLHPLAMSGAIWASAASVLSGSFDVIAPDARGHGSSDWDGQPFSVHDLADDVCGLLDGLGLPAAHVVGLSMGGSTAISLAGRHPGRVSAMVLADTTAWYGPAAPRTWEARASAVLSQPRERQIPFQVERWFTDQFRNRSPAVVNEVVSVFLRTSSLAHAAACRALGTMDSRGLLAAITAPVLVMTGEEDYATPPEMGQAIADGVASGQARILPGLRHLSLVEQPGLADDFSRFLAAGRVAG